MRPVSFDKRAVFSSKRLTFRGICIEDTENLVRWRSREDVYRYSNNPHPITAGEHREWFAKYILRSNEIRTIISDKATSKDIGMVGGEYVAGVFVISYYIGEPEYRRKGLAGEAIKGLIKFVLKSTGITTFHAYVHKQNSMSISCLSRIGFGFLRFEEQSILFEFTV